MENQAIREREMKEKIIEILRKHYDDYLLIDGMPVIKLAAADIEQFINNEVERRIAERMPSEEDVYKEIDKLPCTEHYNYGQYDDGQLAGFEKGCVWIS